MREILEQALQRRRELPDLAAGGTDAFRLVDGAADGLAGVAVDWYAGHCVVETKGANFPEGLRQLHEFTGESSHKSLWWKQLNQHHKQAPKFIAGERLDKVVVMEHGVRFEIDFTSGYSQGLFLDMRPQRRFLAEMVQPGMRVLNLFAYTCGFSVVAAAHGAVTESIDLSRPYLEWGKRNFALNGLPTEPHFFCRGDAFEWLRRLQKKGRQFDLIILDPPTFSRNDVGRIWRVEQDYPALIAAALAVLAEKGRMLCATNHRGLSAEAFAALVREGCRLGGRRQKIVLAGGQGGDFSGEVYLKSLWLEC